MTIRYIEGDRKKAKRKKNWAGYAEWGFNTFELNKAWSQKIANLYPHQLETGAIGRCPICDRYEPLYPIQLRVCDKCAREKFFTQDETEVVAQKYFFPDGEICMICGRKFYVGWIIHTRICHKDTLRIAKMVKQKVEPYHLRIANQIA